MTRPFLSLPGAGCDGTLVPLRQKCTPENWVCNVCARAPVPLAAAPKALSKQEKAAAKKKASYPLIIRPVVQPSNTGHRSRAALGSAYS